MASTPTDQLADYRVGRRIAVGGMAEVFEATRPNGQPCVLKVPLPQYRGNTQLMEHLEHEAALNARLRHDHLVEVDGLERDGETRFLVMELIEGPPLSELDVTLEEAVFVMRQVLAALAYVHEAKDDTGESLAIVHRDISPDNVLLTHEGVAKLGDFGIARSALADARTRTGVIKGKLRYLAPEQVTGSDVDARTDLYSCGVILYELCLGKRWLEADSDLDLLRAAEEPPNFASQDDLPPPLNRFLERTLARFPEERFSGAMEALKVLSEVDVAEAAATLKTKIAAARPRKERQPAKPNPVALLVGAAMAASAMGAMAWFHEPAEPNEDETVVEDELPTGDDSLEEPSDAPPMGVESVDAEVDALSADSGIVDAQREGFVAPPVQPNPRRPPPPRDDVEPTEPDDETAVRQIRERRERLAQSLSARGIRRGDHPEALRTALRAIDRALGDNRINDAESSLSQAEALAQPLAIDRGFVQAKLDRVNARIRRAESNGTLPDGVQALSERALRDFLAGRYPETNEILNQILDRL